MPLVNTVVPAARGSSTVFMRIARLLLGLLGLVLVPSSIYFAFFASADEGGVVTAFDWFLAAWALIVGIGAVVVAVLLGRRSPVYVKAATWLVIAHLVFGAIKLFGYQETEALGFFAFDLLILALLWLGGRSRSHV